MNELTIAQQANISYELPVINMDFATLDATLAALTKMYGNFIVTEEDIKAATDTKVFLNKLSKQLSDDRIKFVKVINEPTKAFEDAIKSKCKSLDDLSNSIKTQLDVYEDARKEKRTTEIKQQFNFQSYMIFDERWLNKTAKDEYIMQDIDYQRIQHDSNVTTIKNLCGVTLDTQKYIDKLNNRISFSDIQALINNDIQVISSTKASFSTPTPKDSTVTSLRLRFVITGTATNISKLKKYAETIGVGMETIQ